MNDENKSSETVNHDENKTDPKESDQQQVTTSSDTGNDEPEKPEGFWNKMKNLLK